MNIQPYEVPHRSWPPKLTYWWFFAARPWRRRALRKQQFVHVEVEGIEHLRNAIAQGWGVMITPNHSFHWDSYCLLESSDKLKLPFYIMTAWQVFAMSSWFECESMQRCGCFSVDRESTDMQAMKTAIDVLQHKREPLVIFPEGDVYHTNDRLTPLRDGAAAMALMAARKTERQVCILPTAIKRWYLDDPTPSMQATTDALETRLYWRPNRQASLLDRILRIADGLVSLKELERFGATRQGDLPTRIRALAESVLLEIEPRYDIAQSRALLPERVKEIRRRIIERRTQAGEAETAQQQAIWQQDMQDMFLVTQLYSYPGDYLIANPTWERMAETLDKLEEDALGARYPTSRGRTTVRVRFDEPILLPKGKEKKLGASDITDQMESRIQHLLDELNRSWVHPHGIPPRSH